MKRPKIAITMGDPAGVGPELCLLALTNPDITQVCVPVVFGDAAVLERAALEIGLEPPGKVLSAEAWKTEHETLEKPCVLDLAAINASELHPGMISAETGKAAYVYVTRAIESALLGEVAAITTAPINKDALWKGGHRYPGHTEILAERTKAERSCMMMTSRPLTCSFVTSHVGYHEVPGLLTVERIVEVIELTHGALTKIKGMPPKLAVLGLNPHAGENGIFGHQEEERIIIPAIQKAKELGIHDIEGPLSPDTAFIDWRREATDGYICMYHDQGLIPLKTLAFDDAINVTLGLPIIRTSVDHGTALDIAWKGTASPNSMFEAILLAVKLAGEK